RGPMYVKGVDAFDAHTHGTEVPHPFSSCDPVSNDPCTFQPQCEFSHGTRAAEWIRALAVKGGSLSSFRSSLTGPSLPLDVRIAHRSILLLTLLPLSASGTHSRPLRR